MQIINLLLTLLTLLTSSVTSLPVAETLSAELIFRDADANISERQAGFWQNWPNVNYGGEVGNYCRIPGGIPSNWCVLTNVMPAGNPVWTSLFLYDHNCNLIGNNPHVPYWEPLNLDSQLPYVVVARQVEGGFFGFAYAGQYWNWKAGDCYNTGGNVLLPACQMGFQC